MDSRLCGDVATAHVSTGSIEGCDARAPVLTALRPFVRERVCAGAYQPHRPPAPARGARFGNGIRESARRIGERNRPAGRALAEVVSDPGLRTEICNSPGMTTDTATADWGLDRMFGSSVIRSSQY